MIHPKKLGPFRIVQVIGRGGMGAVYKAVHEETHQVVALKVAMQLDEESDQRARFEVEIETLKKLRHPNIVRLYGFGQEEGLLYYAMEYVDGPSLQTLQKKKRFFTWEEVVHIGIEVCDALKHAHDRGIIHRDIKPANILLLKDGSVKVSDYGIAHFFGDSRLTGTDMVIGTIEFMSPEQAQAGPLTPKSDIYSLGALLYTLITGFPPYQAKTLPEILQKYKYGPPESIRFTRPEVPQILDLYIMELLRIQPEKRPANARIISRRLEAIRLAYSSDPDANPFLKHQNSDQAPIFPATDSTEHRGETDGQYPYSSDHFAHSSDQFIDPSTRKPGNYQELSSQSIEIPSPETSSRKNPEPTLPANNDSRYDFPFSHNSAAKPSTAARPAGSGLTGREEELEFTLNSGLLSPEGTFGNADSDPAITLPTADWRLNGENPDSIQFEFHSSFLNLNQETAKTDPAKVQLDRPTDISQSSPLSTGKSHEDDTDFSISETVSGSVVHPDTSSNPDETKFATATPPSPLPSSLPETAVFSDADISHQNGLSGIGLSMGDVSPAEWGPDFSNRVTKSTDAVKNLPQQQSAADSVSMSDAANTVGTETEQAISRPVSQDSASVNSGDFPPGSSPNPSDSSSYGMGNEATITLENPLPSNETQPAAPKKESEKFSDSIDSGNKIDPAFITPTVLKADESYIPPQKRSHFTVVQEEELGRLHPESEISSFDVSLKIWIFSLILLATGIFIWYCLREPSADRLYQRIEKKIATKKDEDQLPRLHTSEKFLQKFLNLYPNDPRADKIRNYVNQIQFDNLERRLERQLERRSHDKELSSIELTYIQTIQLSRTDPENGIAKLQAFIDLFSFVPEENSEKLNPDENPVSSENESDPLNAGDTTTEQADKEEASKSTTGSVSPKNYSSNTSITEQYIYLAKKQLEKLSRELNESHEKQLVLLESRFEQALFLEKTDPVHAATVYRAILTLYQGKSWAASITEKVNDRLKALESSLPELSPEESVPDASPNPEASPEESASE